MLKFQKEKYHYEKGFQKILIAAVSGIGVVYPVRFSGKRFNDQLSVLWSAMLLRSNAI